MAKNHTEAQYKAALKKANGVPVRAAEILGVTRQAVCIRLDKSPALQAFVKDIEDGLVEKAVSTVSKAIEAEDLPTSKWLLERKGKHLGFALKSEVESRMADDQLAAVIGALKGDAEAVRRLLDELKA